MSDTVRLVPLVPKLQLGNPVVEALGNCSCVALPPASMQSQLPVYSHRYRVQCDPCPHFLTATINHWLPLFTRPETVNIILDSWRFLQRDADFRLYG